jgi:hypothetical protein
MILLYLKENLCGPIKTFHVIAPQGEASAPILLGATSAYLKPEQPQVSPAATSEIKADFLGIALVLRILG